MASSPPALPGIVVVVPLPTTLLLYPLSTTSDKCGCGRCHLCSLLSFVMIFLSEWPTCSRNLVNTLASLYVTLDGRTISAPRPFGPDTFSTVQPQLQRLSHFSPLRLLRLLPLLQLHPRFPPRLNINQQALQLNFRFRCC